MTAQLTVDEKLAWGAKEDAARKQDIAAVKSGELDLSEAQSRARARARNSGMTPSEAYNWFVEAQRRARPRP